MSDDASLPVVRPRRWPRIAALLLLVALVGGFVVWIAWPKKVTATALFEVRNEAPSLTDNSGRQSINEHDYEILKKTQIALIKSKFLVTSALRDPGVASLSVFAGDGDPEEWLQDHLDLSYPENGEILSISLSGPESQANDLRVIVDAVAEAYKKEALGNETARKLNIRDMLERSFQNLNGEIKRKYEDYLDIAKGMDRTAGGNDVLQQLGMKQMDRVEDELIQLERDFVKMHVNGDTKESKDIKFVQARMEMLTKQREVLKKDLMARGQLSVDLITRKSELDQLQSIANDLAIKLEKMDIDNQIPAQIRQLQPATIDSKQIARQ